MAYRKNLELDKGEAAGAWEQAIERGQLEVDFPSKSAATKFRFECNEWRAAARAAKHELTEEAEAFMLRMFERDGLWWVAFERAQRVVGRRFLTRAEQEEQARAHAEAAAMTARLAAFGPVMTADEAAQVFVRIKKGEGVPRAEVDRARAVLPSLDQFMRVLEANGKRTGDALQGPQGPQG